MARRRRFSANTVRSVGSLLPSDVLSKAAALDGLEGLSIEDFGYPADARLRDVVNDAWNEAKGLWWSFQSELRKLEASDATATSLTRERWLLPLLGVLGFADIETVHGSVSVGEVEYPISHMCGSSPLHLMGARVGLDERASGVRGAARLSPHSVTQQFLNRSDDHLWGITSNGLRLRILRDSVSLTRQAYVEFDLEAMFNGEVFTDFALLSTVAHATRFAGDKPEECYIERWIAAARDDGIRAMDQLRDGVEAALVTFGTGFLQHPDNRVLRDAVDAGNLDAPKMYRHLLRLVYRMLFLFVAEDRDLLHAPTASPEARERYERFYSTGRLRDLAIRPMGQRHSDLWRGLTALFEILGRDAGESALGLPGLGSFLWADDAIGDLSVASLDNESLLKALRGLAYVDSDGTTRRIDFASLGSEELGSVYESLLELHASIDPDERTFSLEGGAGSERKTTGSYYTPTELISELLDSALDPVLDRAARADDPEAAILDLKVVDPAVGSGHFLVAAAHRIGKRLAEARTGEPEPPNDAYRTAVRDVVSRCLFAVDINELAVELCKVSLWLEALEPGKPLSFLDHHILHGNSLFGATPAAIADGIQDDAFVALIGDDKKTVAGLKKRNRKERAGQDGLVFNDGEAETLASEIVALEEFDDSDLDTVRAKERMLDEWKASPAHGHTRLVADAWCAAFAIEKSLDSQLLTESVFRRIRDEGIIDTSLRIEVERLAQQYQFFHWHLAFPQVFGSGDREESPGWAGGFDAVIGNPPWERVKLQEKEFFSPVAPAIAAAPNKAARTAMIERLQNDDPVVWVAFRDALRTSEVVSHFIRKSGEYALSGRGDVNTYAAFVERSWAIGLGTGRVGLIIPIGIATDSTTSELFRGLVESRSLESLIGFYDRKQIFKTADVHGFCLLTVVGSEDPCDEPDLTFFARSIAESRDPGRRFSLTASDFALLNPESRTCPIFRSREDAEITKRIYRSIPIWVDTADPDGNLWGVRFAAMLHMANDSGLFRRAGELFGQGWRLLGNAFEASDGVYLPLYEAKMFHQFDHRWATFNDDNRFERSKKDQLHDPGHGAMPRYWVHERALTERGYADDQSVYVGFRDIARATDERTVIASVLPRAAFAHHVSLVRTTDTESALLLVANLNSLCLDYVARQKIAGTHVSFFIARQLPMIPRPSYDREAPWDRSQLVRSWILQRVAELTMTTYDVAVPDAGDGVSDGPYVWNDERRVLLTAELDSAFFHLYGLDRTSVEHVLETFPVVRRRDTAAYGSYRTKDLIMNAYDKMAGAIGTGEPYQTILDPPPADPSLRVDPKEYE